MVIFFSARAGAASGRPAVLAAEEDPDPAAGARASSSPPSGPAPAAARRPQRPRRFGFGPATEDIYCSGVRVISAAEFFGAAVAVCIPAAGAARLSGSTDTGRSWEGRPPAAARKAGKASAEAEAPLPPQTRERAAQTAKGGRRLFRRGKLALHGPGASGGAGGGGGGGGGDDDNDVMVEVLHVESMC